MEWTCKFSLSKKKIKNGKTEPKSFALVNQAMSAVSEMANQKIFHRDLKPENVLIRNLGSDQEFDIKIIDLGLSLDFANNPHRKFNFGLQQQILD